MVADHLNQLTVTLDGPGVGEDGVAVDDLTAVLTGVLGGYTRLVFDSALSLDMQRLATQFVEVRLAAADSTRTTTGPASTSRGSAGRLRAESRSTWTLS